MKLNTAVWLFMRLKKRDEEKKFIHSLPWFSFGSARIQQKSYWIKRATQGKRVKHVVVLDSCCSSNTAKIPPWLRNGKSDIEANLKGITLIIKLPH